MYQRTKKREEFWTFLLRGEIGQHFWAGAEGRRMVLGRLRAVAVGSFFPKLSSKEF